MFLLIVKNFVFEVQCGCSLPVMTPPRDKCLANIDSDALSQVLFLKRNAIVKATSHSPIFDIPMRLVREDERHRRRFTR